MTDCVRAESLNRATFVGMAAVEGAARSTGESPIADDAIVVELVALVRDGAFASVEVGEEQEDVGD